MNKLIFSTVLACGLLLSDIPEAAAHEERDSWQRSSSYDHYARDSFSRRNDRDYHRDYYRRDHTIARQKRSNKMPRWLQRNQSFRHWFKHSRLQKNRRLSWNHLFDIYRWERTYSRYRGY